MDYLFRSGRLGFRNWRDSDLEALHAINADREVMRFFEKTLELQESRAFILRMQNLFAEYGYCYFATERLEDQRFIGMIGLGRKDFEADFTPCVDIGWRLGKAFWGKGYAPEGARRCLQYAFEALNLQEVLCIAPRINRPSIRVMEKIGLQKMKYFKHPHLANSPELMDCAVYRMGKSTFEKQKQE